LALSFIKKAASAAVPAPSTVSKAAAAIAQETPAPKSGFLGKTKPVPTTVKPAFMKTGSNAKAAIEAADAQAERAKEEAGKLWRFWMPPGEERTITFLDGGIGDDGLLDCGMFYEHRIKVAGEWTPFVCVAENEPCPLCEAGDSKQSLVGALTICDHTPYKVQKGPNAGKIIQNSRKLFVGTRNTIKILAKQAVKKGGLAGCTFEVSRSGDKEPGVGNQFDFVEKFTTAELMAKYKMKAEELEPADYSHEITYRDADELVALGLGKASKGPGHEGKGINVKGLANEL
jgi:hypothetical protein